MSRVAFNSNPAQALAKNVVHVWHVDLDEPARQKDVSHLSSDELIRAGKFKKQVHRARFATGRNILRILLGRYLDRDPGSITFCYGSRGKPRLSPSMRSSLHFNVSHCDEQMLLAFSETAPIGVDIEKLRSLPDELALVQRFFESAEINEYLGLPESLRSQGFLNAWTRKEAVYKARGDGLHLALDAIRVSLDPRRDCCIRAFLGVRERKEDWTLCQLDIASDRVAALATPVPIAQIYFRTASPDSLRSYCEPPVFTMQFQNPQSPSHPFSHAL